MNEQGSTKSKSERMSIAQVDHTLLTLEIKRNLCGDDSTQNLATSVIAQAPDSKTRFAKGACEVYLRGNDELSLRRPELKFREKIVYRLHHPLPELLQTV